MLRGNYQGSVSTLSKGPREACAYALLDFLSETRISFLSANSFSRGRRARANRWFDARRSIRFIVEFTVNSEFYYIYVTTVSPDQVTLMEKARYASFTYSFQEPGKGFAALSARKGVFLMFFAK
jgi:hypothetical protein